MNENKKEYEVGYVDITTEEYKDIITEAVSNRKDAEFERERRWKAESENKLLKEEIALMRKKIAELESELRECFNIDEFKQEVTNNA